MHPSKTELARQTLQDVVGCTAPDDIGKIAAKDVLDIMKWKEIYEAAEFATDKCEDIANVIEGIARHIPVIIATRTVEKPDLLAELFDDLGPVSARGFDWLREPVDSASSSDPLTWTSGCSLTLGASLDWTPPDIGWCPFFCLDFRCSCSD